MDDWGVVQAVAITLDAGDCWLLRQTWRKGGAIPVQAVGARDVVRARETAQLAVDLGCPWSWDELVATAAAHGHPWIAQDGDRRRMLLDVAVRHSQWDVAQALLDAEPTPPADGVNSVLYLQAVARRAPLTVCRKINPNFACCADLLVGVQDVATIEDALAALEAGAVVAQRVRDQRIDIPPTCGLYLRVALPRTVDFMDRLRFVDCTAYLSVGCSRFSANGLCLPLRMLTAHGSEIQVEAAGPGAGLLYDALYVNRMPYTSFACGGWAISRSGMMGYAVLDGAPDDPPDLAALTADPTRAWSAQTILGQ